MIVSDYGENDVLMQHNKGLGNWLSDMLLSVYLRRIHVTVSVTFPVSIASYPARNINSTSQFKMVLLSRTAFQNIEDLATHEDLKLLKPSAGNINFINA